MLTKIRYGTRLAASISSASGSIIVENVNYLQGKSNSGVAAAPISAGDFLRLLKPNPSNLNQMIAEVVEVVSVTPLTGAMAQIAINRADGTFGGTPSEVSGIWAPNGSGVVTLTADAVTNYEFLAGSTVENLTASALLRTVSAGAALDDFTLNVDNGSVAFVNVGNTTAGGFQVDSGMTLSAFMDYKAVSLNRVNLGLSLPNIEFEVDLQHKMPDNRYFVFKAWKCAITPENTDFSFDPTNWIGSALFHDALIDKRSIHAANPIGYFDVQNDPITMLPVSDQTDEYSVGVYDLFITPTNASKALQRGLPTTRFSVGNVRVGSLRSPKQFLEHLVGIPQDLDKKILIRRQFQLETTIEQLNAANIAMLFDGSITPVSTGWLPANTLLEVSQAPSAPYTVANVWHPLGYIMLNVA